MLNQKERPEVYIYSPDKRNCYGVVKGCTEFTEDIRFNTCSEANFNVPNKYYDSDCGKWVNNPYYDKLVKGNLLYFADDTPYFSYQYRKPYEDSSPNSYSITSANIQNRYISETYFDVSRYNYGLNGFKIQNEVELFDAGEQHGYSWQGFTEIVNGQIKSYPHYWSTKFHVLACAEYFPIQPYDIITMWNRHKTIGNWYDAYSDEDKLVGSDVDFQYLYVHFYTDADATTYVGTINMGYNVGNPIYRTSINNLSNSYNTIKEKMKNGGYVRFSLRCNRHRESESDPWNTSYASYYTKNGSYQKCDYLSPVNNIIKIYSGERRCTNIYVDNSGSSYNLYMRWFVVDSVQEKKEGSVDMKSIKAYSYEYTLSNRTISLPDETMAFYIPDKIRNLVNSGNWVIDKVDRKNSNNVDVTETDTAPQYMKTGLLNYILKELPHWTIGHISSDLLAKYRAFSNVDNSSIYNFLMNDIQKAYQCFFVFDNDKQTISAYSYADIMDSNNRIFLTWDNAIKNMTLTNEKNERITALRVHTSEDTYGIGLVNPYGSSVIYNFTDFIDQMDFVADDSDNDPWDRNIISDGNGGTRYRTLKEAVNTMQNFANNPTAEIKVCPNCGAIIDSDNTGHYCSYCNHTINAGANYQILSISSYNDYIEYAKKFVQNNMDYIKISSKLEDALADYRVIVDKINTYLMEDHENTYDLYILSDVPIKPSDFPTNYTDAQIKSHYHSSGFFAELKDASKKYYSMYYQVYTKYYSGSLTSLGKREISYKVLCIIAKKLNLDYQKQKELEEMTPIGAIPSILTSAEILALQPYIIEGDWTNSNAVFSDNYGVDDIIKTLKEVYDQAKTDLDNFYSKEMYEFELDLVNWLALSEFDEQIKKLRVGRPICTIYTENGKWIRPHLLELHLNYMDKDDFKMTFNTNYNQKIYSSRYTDLYDSIQRISISDKQFTFNE